MRLVLKIIPLELVAGIALYYDKNTCDQTSADFSSVWDPLTRLLPKGVLKQELSRIQITTFFRINNYKNINVVKVIFVFKMLKLLCRLQKCNKSSRKCFWF